MFKVLVEGCEPSRGSKYSACVDLYASEDVVIAAGETKLIGLGVVIDKQELIDIAPVIAKTTHNISKVTNNEDILKYVFSSHYLQLMLRSSLSKELVIANGVGVVDLDYEDEIKIRLHYPFTGAFDEKMNNQGTGAYKVNKSFAIKKGDKIAQITLVEHKSYLFGIESEAERTGGFGSTGE